jgi:hypothetical protein
MAQSMHSLGFEFEDRGIGDSFSTSSRASFEPIYPPIQWVTVHVKQRRRESDFNNVVSTWNYI